MIEEEMVERKLVNDGVKAVKDAQDKESALRQFLNGCPNTLTFIGDERKRKAIQAIRTQCSM